MTIQVGNGEVPVVLIHASGSGAQQMKKVAHQLVSAYPSLQVLIPMLAGYGGESSTSSPDPIDQHLSVLEHIANQLSRPYLIVGHSMGAFLALKLAALSGPKDGLGVAGIVAIEPMAFGVLADPQDRAARQEDRDVLARMQARMSAGDVSSGIACFIEYWNQTPWEKIPTVVQTELVASAPQISVEAAAISADPTARYAIDAPVHLMIGERSPLPAQRIVKRLGETLRSSTTEEIPNAGHMSVLRSPEKYVPGVMGLIRRVLAGPASTGSDTLSG